MTLEQLGLDQEPTIQIREQHDVFSYELEQEEQAFQQKLAELEAIDELSDPNYDEDNYWVDPAGGLHYNKSDYDPSKLYE